MITPRRIVGFISRRLQSFRVYRKMGRLLLAKEIIIREAEIDDLLEWKRWHNPAVDESRISKKSQNGHTTWTACWRGKNVGYVQLLRHLDDDSSYPGYWLFSLDVKNYLKGFRIGERLSQVVIDCAISEGADTLKLLVFDNNYPAVRLYEKLGFRHIVIPGLEESLLRENFVGRRRIAMVKDLRKP